MPSDAFGYPAPPVLFSSVGQVVVFPFSANPAVNPYLFSVPAGVTIIQARVWGAGASGATSTISFGGGGGGGGGYSEALIAVTPGASLLVTVSIVAGVSSVAIGNGPNLVVANGGTVATTNLGGAGAAIGVGLITFPGMAGGSTGTVIGAFGGPAFGSPGAGQVPGGNNPGIAGIFPGAGGSGGATDGVTGGQVGGAGGPGLVVLMF